MALSQSIRVRARKRRVTSKGGIPINLVSMIDVLTTLVFFLLVTTASVQTLAPPRGVTLPNSKSALLPRDVTEVVVTPTDIRLGEQSVLSVETATQEKGAVLPQLGAALQASRSERAKHGDVASVSATDEVNILADKTIPFWLLRKIIATCSTSPGFAHVSLAVTHTDSGAFK
ncbi:ExbD/TolR family protein [Paraburkholderia aspalathi]|uniref:ExbD/TolR family protein n=1 Tax=Paraburkholderia aspalathi TaxID=1324617 RepID=UPI003CA81353